jgi:Capsule assembly protein Wzi
MIGISATNGFELRIARQIALAVALFGVATSAHGQSTPTVSPADPVYGFIDRLVAMGAVDSVIVGQRPMSEREIARILRNARGRSLANQTTNSAWLQESLDRYEQFYASRLADSNDARTLRIDRVGADLLLADSPSRGMNRNAGIDISLNPLLANRQGVPSVDGTTAALYAGAEMPLTNWLVASTLLRGDVRRARGLASAGDLRPEQLYLRGLFQNVAVSIGRDYVFFGQAADVSMMNSLNPRALDMLRVSSDHPFVMPFVSRFLGPLAGTFYLSYFGGRQKLDSLGNRIYAPYAQLVGYKLSAHPFSHFEIGTTVNDEVGGRGSPGGTFLQKTENLFPLLDAALLHRTFRFSKRFAGIDARWSPANAMGLQLYMDGALNDFDLRRLKSSLTDDGGYIWGATLDCLRECGTVRVTTEYQTTGLRYYTSGYLPWGYTLDQQVIGNPLGPEGQGGYLSIELDRVNTRFSLTAAHEIRSGDVWGTVSTTSNDADFHFVIVQQRPSERRWRLMGNVTVGHPTSAFSTRLAAGVERVERFGFVPGADRNNVMAEIGFEMRPSFSRRR